MDYCWDEEKNQKLKEERNISFEDIIVSINNDDLIDIIKHPNKVKYPSQNIYIVCFSGYAYMVPFVKDNDSIFLKTIIPSRKINKLYGGQCND